MIDGTPETYLNTGDAILLVVDNNVFKYTTICGRAKSSAARWSNLSGVRDGLNLNFHLVRLEF
jgi:hypothetical protein